MDKLLNRGYQIQKTGLHEAEGKKGKFVILIKCGRSMQGKKPASLPTQDDFYRVVENNRDEAIQGVVLVVWLILEQGFGINNIARIRFKRGKGI